MTTNFYTQRRESISTLKAVLDNAEVAVKGYRACIDTSTGNLKVAGTSTTLLPIGVFTEGLTGDGTTETLVQLDEELSVRQWDNDSAPNDVANSDRGSSCYMKDGKTVSMLSTGRSIAGIVLGIDPTTSRVRVLSGLHQTGATGASGRTGSVATRTALKAIAAGSRADQDLVTVRSDGSTWKFVAASTLADDGLVVESCNIVITPGSGTGRWVRQDQVFTAKIAVSKDTADAAQLMLVPAGYSVKIFDDLSWDVTTGFTGGSSSAIGVSSSNAGSSTKGDLLGGASGDVTATLGTTGVKQGTAGAQMDTIAHRRALRIEATEYLRFDRITSAFTAGAGYVNVPMLLELVG